MQPPEPCPRVVWPAGYPVSSWGLPLVWYLPVNDPPPVTYLYMPWGEGGLSLCARNKVAATYRRVTAIFCPSTMAEAFLPVEGEWEVPTPNLEEIANDEVKRAAIHTLHSSGLHRFKATVRACRA